MVNVSISGLRNELYVFDGDEMLFQLNGHDDGADYTEFSEAKGLEYVQENFGDVIEDLKKQKREVQPC